MLFRDAERWLTKPVHDAPIYASSEKIWASLAGEFQGGFRQMLYDDDVPDDAEVIAVLDMLGLQLRNTNHGSVAFNSVDGFKIEVELHGKRP